MTNTLTLVSWNINARAVYKNGFMDWLAAANADIICLQETRADEHQFRPIFANRRGITPFGTHRAAKRATAARPSSPARPR